MPAVTVYHNPHFLDYRGDHAAIVPPLRPLATVQVPASLTTIQALGIAYRQTQHRDHLDGSWWNRDNVRLHVRSTSVGDLLADPAGVLFVVERVGFRPYRPQVLDPYQQLAETYRRLDDALARADAEEVVAVARQLRAAIGRILAADGYPRDGAAVVFPDNVQPGDLIGRPDIGLFRVIARKLRPRWRARRLLAHVPAAQLWPDGRNAWAVVAPVQQH